MHVWLQTAVVITAAMAALWAISLRIRDVSIVDLFWGTGFAVVALWTFFAAGEGGARSTALTAVVAAWGVRLSAYLAWRNLGKGEDRRYAAMRESYGARFGVISLFTVFVFQGALIWVVSLPVQWALVRAPDESLGAVQLVGLVIAAGGIIIESVADLQLARFKRAPDSRGKVMDRGLWRYSRHPNYFGDFLVWWGIFLLAFSPGSYPITAIGPAIMSIMLLRVSGVALLEKDIAERRPAYADYIRRTSAFVPLPPRTSG